MASQITPLPTRAVREPERLDPALQQLIDALHARYHYDFRNYAAASLKRRIGSALLRFHCESVPQLQEKALADAGVFAQLLDYLTVQVSDMFRDPPFFAALREHVLPVLATYPYFKIWIAGCSSGEEAYSLAILLRETGLLQRALIYATDINPRALAHARTGIYPVDRAHGFAANHAASGGSVPFSDYYTSAYGGIALDKSLRQNIVFADHSLATDSVFAEVQLVCCRNVLIYFDRVLQDRAIGLFRDALCKKGFLGIGARESLRFTAHSGAFADISGGEKILQKIG